ncbi:transmembrane protein, putative (macronuclear) [Tetrahymena thermophila SB210]|uniref:Transmembrane protein, putative n=1 Tax=Tetrahymena thermophila (strain SB210) TaxID=312017 RepID=Q235W2_TETTS|nr:transmembrane protein, putative [Tetrahymena thermophila SB210]EAR92638.2 transmembrane protein, putative [Tetrahymena thermophila SB210]|eukprot:XP_001012883.2 transmembrane protein, putative [Tetrahymena thermophila SB210]
MPELVKQAIQKCDIFGNAIGLNMNQQNIYKSKFGGFISIVVGIIIAYYFWTNFIIFINQEKMTVTSEIEYDINPSNIVLGQNSLMFAINIYQTNLDFLTNPFFNIVLNIGVFENKGTTFNYKYLPVELEPCTEAHFQAYFNAKYVSENIETDKQNIINNFLCPKLDQSFNLSGLYLSPVFNFVRIQVKRCIQSELNSINPNWKVKCAPSDSVSQFLDQNGNFRVSVYHNNYLISPDKNTQYAQAYLNQDLSFLFVPNQMFKSVDVFLKDYNIKTNNYGFFTSQTNYEQYIVYDYKDYTESTTLGQQGDIYTEVFLRRSPYTQIYTREHENFTQFLSSLGGFINILITVVGIFIRKYNYFQFTIDLANKLYNFDLEVERSKSNSTLKDQADSKNSNLLQITPQQDTPLKLVQSKITNNNLAGINNNYITAVCLDSPSKMSRKSSKIVTEDVFKFVESPQTNLCILPSQNEIAKASIIQNPKNSQQTIDNKNKTLNNISVQMTSFSQLQKNEISKQSRINKIKQKIWRAIKLINNPNQEQMQVLDKKEKNINQSISKLREQIQNYKQLGFSNKADFLFSNFKKLIKRQQQKIKFSLSYLFRAFKCNHQQNVVLLKAQNSVSMDLDIYTILQKLQEVEKIKRILFNKDQNTLFSFCPKPVISYISQPSQQKTIEQNINIPNTSAIQEVSNPQTQNDHLLVKNNDFEQVESYQRLYQAFDKIKKKENKNGLHIINNRLIKELGAEINEIFELSREVVKEGDEIQKQAILDSSINVSKKRKTISQQTFNPSQTRHRQLSKYNQPHQYIHLNSMFNSHNQLKTKEELPSHQLIQIQDDQNIESKPNNHDASLNRISIQQTANISLFEIENKSQNLNFDTIPDIPFEPGPESNITKSEFQKETKLKQIL